MLTRPSRTSRPRTPAAPRPRQAPKPATPREQTPPAARVPPDRPDVEGLVSRWQLALDAGDRALSAAAGTLPAALVVESRRALAQERQQTAELLSRLARIEGVHPVPWLSPVPVTRQMLGLPAGVRACLFELDGVLTDSATVHAWAWGEVFDDFLLRLAQRTGWQFIPFDQGADYRDYIDGRPRLEGVHAFLDSRGIRLPEGGLDDPPDAGTAHGLAKRKGLAVLRALQRRGVTALPGARGYLEAAGRAGLSRAVISASASTLAMLELAELTRLAEASIDADAIRSLGLRSAPAPDLVLAACRRLSVEPESAVTFTHSAAGVAAGRAAGLTVIGVGEGPQGENLQFYGAERVVPSLTALLDPRLVAATADGDGRLG